MASPSSGEKERADMLKESARVIHIGVNYVVAPKKAMTVDEKLKFQKELSIVGIDAENIKKKREGIAINAFYEGTPLIVETFMNSPNTGQLLIVMPENPNSILFPQIADAVGDIYLKVFTDPKPKACPAKDGCIRKLYSCGEGYPHAFKYIWEKMLGKTTSHLSPFGKPIAGGGLRFVMPPSGDDPVETQVRIESFFSDPKSVWIEVTMKWLQPEKIESGFRATQLCARLNSFLNENVVNFVQAQS